MASEATKKALERYNEKFERINIRLPMGLKERIGKLGYKAVSAFIALAVAEKLEKEEGRMK